MIVAHKMFGSAVWKKPGLYLKTFLALIHKCHYKPFLSGKTWYARGQTPPLTIRVLQKELMTRSEGRDKVPAEGALRRVLVFLMEQKMIEARKLPDGSFTIKIVNYDLYQNPYNYTENPGLVKSHKDIIRQRERKIAADQRREDRMVEYVDRYWDFLSAGDTESASRLLQEIEAMIERKDLPKHGLRSLKEIVAHRKATRPS